MTLVGQKLNGIRRSDSPIAPEVHTTSDLHKKQPDKTLQEYIQNLTDLTETTTGADPTNITNRVIIFLFFKNLYNCDIHKCITHAKTINTQADAFRISHQSLVKLKNTKVYCIMRSMKYQKCNNPQAYTKTQVTTTKLN